MTTSFAARRRTRRLRVTGTLIAVLVGGSPYAQHPAEPVAVIEETAERLVVAVAARRAELREDADAQAQVIESVLLPVFDLEQSSALILRSSWAGASPAERRRFVAAFYDYLVAAYGDALHYVGSDTFAVLPDQPETIADRYRVSTRLTMHDGKTFELQFYLRKRGDKWSVVDVIVDGVSYVRTYRADFGALLRDEGLDGLIGWLREATVDQYSAR